MLFSNKTYETLKWIVGIALPAVGVFYALMAGLWDLPKPVEVTGTLAGLAALLGALIAKSTSTYNNSDEKYDGTIVPSEANAQTTDSALSLDRLGYIQPREVLLKVVPPARE